jgi:hypothetical protein
MGQFGRNQFRRRFMPCLRVFLRFIRRCMYPQMFEILSLAISR